MGSGTGYHARMRVAASWAWAIGSGLAIVVACASSSKPPPAARSEPVTVQVPEPAETPEPEPIDAGSDVSQSAVALDDDPVDEEEADEHADPLGEGRQGFGISSLIDSGLIGVLSADGGVGFGSIGLLDGGFGLGSGRLGRRDGGGSTALGAAQVTGNLDKDIIRRYIRRSINQIRYCYEKELAKDPKLSTKVSPRFVIGTTGSVTSVSLAVASPNAALNACVTRVVKQLRFPAPKGGVVVVTYPFVFQPG